MKKVDGLDLPQLYHLYHQGLFGAAMCGARPNGSVFSRAQGLLTNQDDDHAKYLSQKARVFGVGCNTVLGTVSLVNVMPCPDVPRVCLG
jgi:hypothetical protein